MCSMSCFVHWALCRSLPQSLFFCSAAWTETIGGRCFTDGEILEVKAPSRFALRSPFFVQLHVVISTMSSELQLCPTSKPDPHCCSLRPSNYVFSFTPWWSHREFLSVLLFDCVLWCFFVHVLCFKATCGRSQFGPSYIIGLGNYDATRHQRLWGQWQCHFCAYRLYKKQ